MQSNYRYWDTLRQMNYNFLNSERTIKNQVQILNSDDMKIVDDIQATFLTITMEILEDSFKEDIDNLYVIIIFSFSSEKVQNEIIFIVYLFYLTIVYILFWRTFISNIQVELWKTKSILSVLSPELMMSISEIRSYILNNSSTVLFSGSGHK